MSTAAHGRPASAQVGLEGVRAGHRCLALHRVGGRPAGHLVRPAWAWAWARDAMREGEDLVLPAVAAVVRLDHDVHIAALPRRLRVHRATVLLLLLLLLLDMLLLHVEQLLLLINLLFGLPVPFLQRHPHGHDHPIRAHAGIRVEAAHVDAWRHERGGVPGSNVTCTCSRGGHGQAGGSADLLCLRGPPEARLFHLSLIAALLVPRNQRRRTEAPVAVAALEPGALAWDDIVTHTTG